MKQLDIIELAKEQKLLLAPKKYLSEEDLLKKNSIGKTTFQLLAQKGLFKQIPKHLITEKVLLEKDNIGASGLHYLAKARNLHLLPSKFQSKELLESKDYFGLSVKDYENYNKILNNYRKLKLHELKIKRNCYDYAMEY